MEVKKDCEDVAKMIREIKMVQIMFDQNLTRILSKFDLTSTQAPVLKMISEYEKEGKELGQKDIEEFFHLKNPTVTGILDRLEKKKFIVRKVSKDDRRKRIITLTKKSRQIIEESDMCLKEFRKKAVEGVKKEEFLACANIIDKMVANLEKINMENN